MPQTHNSPKRTVALLVTALVISTLAAAKNLADKDYVTISDGPAPIKRVEPQYPPIARDARIQGQVVCEIIVGRDGKVEKGKVLSGHPLLVKAALNAVKQWEWKPLVLGNKTYRVRHVVVVNFTLSSDTLREIRLYPHIQSCLPNE